MKEEAYQLYQATSRTPAIRRFTQADETGVQNSVENQRNWNQIVLAIQEIL
ncbi:MULTISPECIES: hypothetical protein [Crateriforma]|uniref:hypothetical protein n=1 Tax=Crateriforma TaxID=2714592 RepID=UPI0018CF1335|nr:MULTISPECIES: hypothetical protein [Crateriforma]